jgi:hypothetical protein
MNTTPHEDASRAACLVRGRRFVQRGDNWVDEAVEHMPQAKRIRVKFDTPEFFKLLLKRPDLLEGLSSARNMQVALGDTIYEIFE